MIEIIVLSNGPPRRTTLAELTETAMADHGPFAPVGEITFHISEGRGWWAGPLGPFNVNIVRADKVRPLLLG